MRVHDPLGPARGARAVEHQAGIVSRDGCGGKRAFGGAPGIGVGNHRTQLRQFGPHGFDDRDLVTSRDHHFAPLSSRK